MHMKGPVGVGDGGGGDEVGKQAESKNGEGDQGAAQRAREEAVLTAVVKVQSQFWMNVTAVVNEGLDDEAKLTEERVKEIYDASKGDAVD